MSPIKRTIVRVEGREWCALEVELSNRNGKGLELSICGSHGEVMNEKEARRALASLEGEFHIRGIK